MVNGKRLLKYLIMLFIVSMSTYYIPNCSIINEHAFYVGYAGHVPLGDVAAKPPCIRKHAGHSGRTGHIPL